ncbi:MAG: hypothetical protein EAZ81_09310 [Verrucomicrobia bacterium]|nr:MAG: hypothetical protein EAZ81_09310 [Verrucomicrobiota bacterium]
MISGKWPWRLDCGSPAAAFSEAALLRAGFRSLTAGLGEKPSSLHRASEHWPWPLDCGSPAAAFSEAAPAASWLSLTDRQIGRKAVFSSSGVPPYEEPDSRAV